MKKFITLLALSLLIYGMGATASARTGMPDNSSKTFIMEDGSSGPAEVLYTDMNFVSVPTDFVTEMTFAAPEPTQDRTAAWKAPTVSELRQLYNAGSYVPCITDIYNPASAGIESFLIPGLGQIITGYPWRGAAFLVAEGVLTTAATITLVYQRTTPSANKAVTLPIAGICLGMAVVSHIWCIVDAVQVTKLKNLYMRDAYGRQCRTEMSFAPFVTAAPDLAGNIVPQAGAGLRISF